MSCCSPLLVQSILLLDPNLVKVLGMFCRHLIKNCININLMSCLWSVEESLSTSAFSNDAFKIVECRVKGSLGTLWNSLHFYSVWLLGWLVEPSNILAEVLPIWGSSALSQLLKMLPLNCTTCGTQSKGHLVNLSLPLPTIWLLSYRQDGLVFVEASSLLYISPFTGRKCILSLTPSEGQNDFLLSSIVLTSICTFSPS